MSFDFNPRGNSAGLDFSDLIDASSSGLLAPAGQTGRRARKRTAKQRFTQATMLAPLLATEGCLTLGGHRDDPLGSDGTDVPGGGAGDGDSGGGSGSGGSGSGGGSVPPPSNVSGAQDDSFSIDIDQVFQFQTHNLLDNDILPAGATGEGQVVRVFGAVNGTVTLSNGVVTFTPTAGYEGVASFQYESRDSLGNLSQASVEINVGDVPDGGMGGMPGMGDMAMMEAMLALVPVGEATHVAVNNGSWFDPNTWANGQVPGEDAKVVIPQGIEVIYDGESAVSLFTVRVDGALEFATDRDTFMEVDTMVVTPMGRLTIGTMDNPVAPGVNTVIQFADNGPIDVNWDPTLLSRGLISHGMTQIHGAEKESFIKVAIDPMAGATSITLDSPPDGWKVGDKLVLTGTHLTPTQEGAPMTPRNDQTEDEELTITSIVGNQIFFNTPLQYNHEGARSDLKAYVANYSRNVQFVTENADDVPAYQRGHVMLMRSDMIDVRYAEFNELGRTDKSERAFDAGDIANIQSDSNVKGRYALHLHKTGVDDPDDPAYLVGNAVWGSPGWGVVQHSSNAIMAENAAYNVYGAAFVAEQGDEIGRWVSNIAIKSIGNNGGAKWVDDVAAFDLGRTGAGFWFQGRLVEAVDNVAAGVPGGHGFVYMSRGNELAQVDSDTVKLPESLGYLGSVGANVPTISGFRGNEAFAVSIGLEVIKASSEQGSDVRTIIDDFLGWEVGTGIHLQYTAHYTLTNIDLVATDSGRTPWRGIEYGPNAVNMVINGADISGFPTGFYAAKENNNMNFPFNNDWGYVFVDVNVTGATTNFGNTGAGDIFLTGAQLVQNRLTLDSDIVGVPVTPTPESGGYIFLSGTKTDSIGADEVSPTWDPIRLNYFNLQGAIMTEGYWTLPDGRKVTVVEQYFADRATGEVEKVGVVIEWERNFSDFPSTPAYNGVLDLDSLAPTANNDFATVDKNGSIIINVLANDTDPDGDDLEVDGFLQAEHGSVYQNPDGTLTYVPDPNYSGSDEFWYWVDDGNGNFDKGFVQINVEV
jgi:hypothetical protein